ncbi:MAG: hypothetical protein Q8P73_05000 [bacterium]|nr:hypothetical protein [bacterium]MDZ4347777.1 hypothetical protein [Candidatus Binatia bacterium]
MKKHIKSKILPATAILINIFALSFAVSTARAAVIQELRVTTITPAESHSGFLSSLRFWLSGKTAVPRPAIGTTYIVNSSAYAPSPYQTDSTPCITAAGTRVREGVVASNFLPLGTILSINDDLYIVEDRMNPRYSGQYIDIWFPSTEEALQFGRRKLEAVIIDYGTPGQALTTDANDQVVKPSIFKRANLRFVAIKQSLSGFMSAALTGQDVDCFATE